mgnify:CR=1 FL=1
MEDYRLDPLLDETLREQMIDGGVPEDEVQPSIDDIEESMTKKLKDNDRLTSMEHKAELANEPFPTHGLNESAPSTELTEDDYDQISPELNEKIRNLIKEMRAVGTPEDEIMQFVVDTIHAAVTPREASIDRMIMPSEHLGFYEEGAEEVAEPNPDQTLTPHEIAAIEVAIRYVMADDSLISVMQNPEVAANLESALGKLRYL